MQIETINKDRPLMVRFNEKRLNVQATTGFRKTVSLSLHNDIRKIAINPTKTEFMDSSRLGAIIARVNTMGNGGEIAIRNTNEPVMQVFKPTRTDQVFNALDREEDAIIAIA